MPIILHHVSLWYPTVDKQYLFFATFIYTQSHGTVRSFYALPQLSPLFLVNPSMR